MHEAKNSADPGALQEARRATGDAPGSARPEIGASGDSEVVPRARRRTFSNAEKRRILQEADQCTKPGEIGALMRREGVYSSSLSTWRRQREAADLAALAPQKRGPKIDASRADAQQIAQLIRPVLGARAACRAMGLWRGAPARELARSHRRALVGPPAPRTPRPCPPLAFSAQEQQTLLDALNSERFADTAPAAVHAMLLDEGTYLGSVRTMYRLLAADGGCRERRNQRAHPAYTKPELLAMAPNQVWSWDITKLKGPAKWTCFHLYVILDIFSRFVVGWLIAPRECSELAQQLIADTVARHDVQAGMLTLHADRGAAMRSKPVASLLIDLDVAKSHSRPHVSDDNPYSESQFKTLKYRPEFPQRFGCIEDARTHCQAFFAWYNDEHCHSGVGYMTPHSVHYGLATQMRVGRQATLDAAFQANPNRFKSKPPRLPPMPTAAWINPPKEQHKQICEPVLHTLN